VSHDLGSQFNGNEPLPLTPHATVPRETRIRRSTFTPPHHAALPRRNAVYFYSGAYSLSKNQVVYIPKGDPAKAKLLCEGFKDEPCKSLRGPFHLGIDQQNRIWVTNAMGDSVARFPASDPTKVETFKAGFSGSGLGIDSLGNVWVTNRLGSSARGGAAMEAIGKVIKSGGDLDEVLTRAMAKQTGGADGGSVTVLRPDGTQYPARRSPVADFPVLGPWPWTATQLLRFSQ
jgi:hypothetical protein